MLQVVTRGGMFVTGCNMRDFFRYILLHTEKGGGFRAGVPGMVTNMR